jgi:hypothetical protein
MYGKPMEHKVLDIVGKYRSGDELSLEDFKVIMEYCRSLGKRCGECVLHRKFGKCPIVISVR